MDLHPVRCALRTRFYYLRRRTIYGCSIIGRAICGVAGSGMYVGVMAPLAATTTMHERPMYIGGTGLTWGLRTVLGLVIDGFSDSLVGWR